MTRTFWTIWDCASYDVIMEMMDEGAVPNLRRIMKKQISHRDTLHQSTNAHRQAAAKL